MRNTINVKSRKEIKHVISTMAPLHSRRVHILHFRHPKGLSQSIATQARRITKRVDGWTSNTYEWNSRETTVVIGKPWIVDRIIRRPGDVYIPSIEGRDPMYYLFYMEPTWHALARIESYLNCFMTTDRDSIRTRVDSSRIQELIHRIPEIFEKYTPYDWAVSVVASPDTSACIEVFIKKEN